MRQTDRLGDGETKRETERDRQRTRMEKKGDSELDK